MVKKLTPKEQQKADAKRKRIHAPINKQIRGAKGVSVDVDIGTAKPNKMMSDFIRAGSGRVIKETDDGD